MQIDWITVSAQIVNFLALVYLLQHFLYQPVIQAMDKRERRIADRLNNAEQREIEASEQIDVYKHKQDQLSKEHKALLDRYRQEALAEKQKMLESARQDVDQTRSQWRRQAEHEKQEFLDSLRRQTGRTVTGIARKALAELAGTELEERAIEVFIGRLKNLDEETRRIFSVPQGGELRVSTAFELDKARRKRIEQAVNEHIGKNLHIEFQVSPELECGIRLGDDGHVLEWNLADYMDQVTEEMDGAIEVALRRS